MNGEKGQALPLAILALTIGTLVIAPFLGHASSSIIGSKTYAEAIAFRDACDAGVEHAIWGLTWGTLAAQLPDPGDTVTYQLPETINNAAVTVTVTANATGGGGAVGQITKTVIDSFDFENAYCYTPNIIHISGNIYAIAYEGPASDGFLRTVEIAPDGNITNSAIDTLEFDTSDCYTPDISHVSGNIYAIAYRGPSNDGFLKTVTIAANGDIGNSVIDTLEYDTSDCYEPDIIYVSGNYYAIAYRGPSNDGFLKTVTIAANGDIGNSVIDTLEFDTSNCFQPDIIYVSGTYFAIAYQGVSSDGFLKSVTIAANGDIGNSVIDTLEFDISDCAYPDVINVSGNTYAVAYQGTNADGFLKTMTISATGSISNSVIDSFEFDPVNGQEPKIIYVKDNTFAIAYDGPQNDGYLITLPIESSGNIPGTVTDTFEYDTSNGYYPDIIIVSDGIYAIAYCVPSSKGSLVTIGVGTGGTAAAYRIAATAGNTTIRAFVNTDNTTATIVSWQIQ
jgi:hypothetical protein